VVEANVKKHYYGAFLWSHLNRICSRSKVTPPYMLWPTQMWSLTMFWKATLTCLFSYVC